MKSYEAYRRNKLESGHLYQDFVVDVLFRTIGLVVVQYASRAYQIAVGESRTGIEIKHDEKFATTGNLWIEIAEKARPREGDYVPAGIERSDNTWLYVIGDYNTIFAIPKAFLRRLAATGRYPIRENGTFTSRGFLLPERDARTYAAFVLTPNAQEQVAKVVGGLEALGRVLHQAVLSNPAQMSLLGIGVDEATA